MDTLRSVWVSAWAVAVATGCVSVPLVAEAQPVLEAGQRAGGELPLTLKTKVGRMYRWESSTTLGPSWAGLPVAVASRVPLVAPAATMNLSVSAGLVKEFFRVKETAPFEPTWSDVKPLRTLRFQYDLTKSADGNGGALRAAIMGLIAGDHLVIAPGVYSFLPFTNFAPQGTAAAPIRITAGPAGGVKFTRPDADQNLMNLGASGGGARFLAIQGIEMTGGSTALRLGDCQEIWIDGCNIHDMAYGGIASSTHNNRRLYITRNEIHRIGDLGFGVVFGMPDGSVVTRESVIALNHLHHMNGPDVTQGYGAWVRRGSWGNVVSGNLVHDCLYPCLLMDGTNGNGVNLLENNVCYASADYGMQVAADCVVRNNVVFGSSSSLGAFNGTSPSVTPTRMTVTHNTFISQGSAVRLANWGSGADMVFANNACYSSSGEAIRLAGTAGSTVFAGLVTFGVVPAGVPTTASVNGLGDFVGASWDGSLRNVTPSAGSPLRGAPVSTHLTEYDQEFYLRTVPQSTGARR